MRGSASSTRTARLLNIGLSIAGCLSRSSSAFSGWSTPIACWDAEWGVAFLVPFVVFLAMRAIPGAMIPRLAGVFVLGGVQGLLGWYMVKSGLIDEPRVSQYRLAAHLSLAVLIYMYLIALALRMLDAGGSQQRDTARLARRVTLAAGVTVFLTLVMGAFVAGLKAGHVYPTFPKMGGFWAPPGMFETSPWWKSFFENPVTAQFTHRVLALASCLVVVAAWGASLRAGVRRQASLWATASLAAVIAQIVLGVSTLLLHVPIRWRPATRQARSWC